MRYLSLFSGIGGFELGITQAYEEINRICDCGECGTRRGQNCACGQDNLFQSGGRKTKGRGDIESRDTLPTKKLDGLLDNRPTGQNKEKVDVEQGCTNIESKHTRQSPTCIGYSEIDKYAIQIYQKHFPEHKNYGDITKINETTLPDFDLLVGGFPCQAFSIAGKRKGFEDTRGTLFFEIARILRAKQPRLLLLENVKGLLSHDNGQTFSTIISTLDELGYDLQWQVLNSKNFGVPQNRERVFIVGHLRGTPRPKVFPFASDNGEDNAVHEGEGEIASTVTCHYAKNQSDAQYVDEQPRIRRLTPTECERLQGFPDGWTEGLSDTQRYKCLGNAVTVNVIKYIISGIL